jgi:uncharacterized protein
VNGVSPAARNLPREALARDSALNRWLSRLARAQVERPWRFVVACSFLAALCGLLATRLELRTRFEELLPEARPSVVELKRLHANVSAASHVFVVVEGGDRALQRAYGDGLVLRLRKLAPPWLVACDDGVHEARRFLTPRAGMFTQLSELQRLGDDVEARWSWEVGKETGTNLDDDPPPSLAWNELKQRLDTPKSEQFPDGYFQKTDVRALVVNVETSLATGDLKGMRAALGQIQAAAEAQRLEQGPTRLKLGYAGDLVTGLAEYGAAVSDLVEVGVLGLALVSLVMFLFFLRVRALLALAAALFVGLSWTFGITYLTIGHLNVATGFLVSIVAGNGINFGIIYVARVYEERLRGRELKAAIAAASLLTRRATLSAALAASAAYASLAISDFHAFRHFALIGGVGMLVCWLAAFLFLPSALLLAEQAPPLWRSRRKPGAERIVYGQHYGAPLAAVVGSAPRFWAVSGLAVGALGLASLFYYVRADPLEYDMRRLQNDLGSSSEMYRASKLAGDIMGANRDGAMVMLADRPEQAPLLAQALKARRDAALTDQKPFEDVHTVTDFVPADQAEKLPILLKIRERLVKAKRRGFVSDADFAQLSPYLPPADLTPWSVADLPASVQRAFRDKSGTVGRLVFIEPTAGQSDSDVKYLMRWAESFREVRLPHGEVVRGSGRAVIFADILQTVMRDIPRTVTLSLAMTLLVVLATRRRGPLLLMVMGSLVVGLGAVVLAMWLLHIKINFFNFVALPISFGIGVDYAVNFALRYDEDPSKGAVEVLRSAGGAILLCSLTTTLGYLALLGSVNQAIRSLGLLAVLGEVGCLLAATLVLPACLVWRERAGARVVARAAAM